MAYSKESNDQTIQIDVPPGRITGIYHIIVCNVRPTNQLPFHTSWQQFKDWLRPACEVDHVELFENSTSGWVRVRGKRNFKKAWEHINASDFQGRSIIADGRNEKETIKIKEFYDVPVPSSRGRQAAHPFTQPTSPARTASPVSAYSYAYREGAHDTEYAMPRVSIRHDGAYDHADSSDYGYYSARTLDPQASLDPYASAYYGATPAYSQEWKPVPQHMAMQQNVSFSGKLTDVSTLSAECSSHEGRDHSVVLLKNLPHKCSHNDIEGWVRRRFGSHAHKAFKGVAIPLDEKNECTRGRAHVMLKSPEYVALATKKLHHKTFKNRTITAALVKPEETTREPTSRVSRSRVKGSRNKSEESSKSEAATMSTSESDAKKHRMSLSEALESKLVIAEGTSKKGKGKKR